MANKKQLTVDNYSLSEPTKLIQFAETLKQFIKEQNLYSNIHGKGYVQVDAWQFAGSMIGLSPILRNTVDLSEGDKIKYRAEVEIIDVRTQHVVGAGTAICDNKEPGKKAYAEFAIASMAQTRATGKAYRNILAWLIKAAGYETTPLEEMDSVDFSKKDDQKQISSTSKQAAEPVKKQATKQVTQPAPKAQQPLPERERPAQADPGTVQHETVGDKKLASVKQKTELLLLLNNKHIDNEAKNRMIEKINHLTSDRIEAAIKNLKALIAEREVAGEYNQVGNRLIEEIKAARDEAQDKNYSGIVDSIDNMLGDEQPSNEKLEKLLYGFLLEMERLEKEQTGKKSNQTASV